MACVQGLGEELMASLGIQVERSSAGLPSSRSCTPSNVRGSARKRSVVVAEQGGQIRRRSNDNASMGVEYPYAPRLEQQTDREEQRKPGDNGRRSSTYDRLIDAKYARPNSAKSRGASSHGGAAANTSPAIRRSASNMNCSKDMGVLLQICRDHGRGYPLDPADFDSSISAICNLPVGPFVGAAREGWGRYFHDLHRKMRARETISAGYKRPQSTRKGRSSAEGTHRPPGRQRRSGQQQPPAPATTYYGNPRRNSADTNLRRTTYTSCNRRPTQDCDSLAESRAPLATRAATENATRRMAIRLQTLWQELKIPKPDRAYVVAAYLNGCGDEGGGTGTAVGCAEAEGWPTSVEVHRELVRQITLLLEYRAATIKVLNSVSLRESRLADVEQALQSFQWHRGRDTDAIGLVDALAGLRDTSRDVVQAVVGWRKHLWQPRAFCWRGDNYLEKMSRDTNFLRSPAGRSLLASVGLEAHDMTFVLFPSSDGENVVPPDGDRPGTAAADVRPPPAIVRLTPKAELVAEYRTRFNKQSSFGVVDDERTDGFRTTAANKTTLGVELVLQEAALQNSLETDRARLATKGYFVPLLRWLPVDKSIPRGKRQRPPSSAIPPSSAPMPGVDNDIASKVCNTGADATNHYVAPPAGTGRTTTSPRQPPTTETEANTMKASIADGAGRAPTEKLGGGTGGEPGGRPGGTTEESAIVGDEIGDEPVKATQDGEASVNTNNTQGRNHDGGIVATGEGGQGEEEEWGGGGGGEDEKKEEEEKEEEEEEEDGGEEWEEEGGGGRGWEKEEEEEEEELDDDDDKRVGAKEREMEIESQHGDGLHEQPTRLRGGEGTWKSPTSTDSNGYRAQSRAQQNKNKGTILQVRVQSIDPEGSSRGESRSTRESRREQQESRGSEKSGDGNVLLTRDKNGESLDDGIEVGTSQVTNKTKSTSAHQRSTERSASIVTDVDFDTLPGEGINREKAHATAGQGGQKFGTPRDLEVDERPWKNELNGGSDNASGGGSGSITCSTKETQSPDVSRAAEESERSAVLNPPYDDDFEDDREDSSVSDLEMGADDTYHSTSSPSNYAQAAPKARAEDDAGKAAEKGSTPKNRKSALVIQCAWRRKAAVQKAEIERRRRRAEKENAAAIQIQTLARVASAEEKVRRLRAEACRQEKGATKLQAWLLAWRANRETQMQRTKRAAAIRIQSAARGKRASDEVNELPRHHEAQRTHAAVTIQTLARRQQKARGKAQARVEAQTRAEAQRRGEAQTRGEVQARPVEPEAATQALPRSAREEQTRVESTEMKNNRNLTTIQAEVREANPRRRPSTGTIKSKSLSESNQALPQGEVRRSEKEDPDIDRAGSSTASASSQAPTLTNSSSSLTSSGLRSSRSSSYTSDETTSSRGSGSLSTSYSDDNSSSSVDSETSPGTKHQQRKTDDGTGQHHTGLAVVGKEKLLPSLSGATTVEERAKPPSEEASEAGDREETPPVTAQADNGGVGPGPDSPLLVLTRIVAEEDSASGVREEDRGASSSSSLDAVMDGVGGLVALAPVPEDRSLPGTIGEEYGSEDLNFDVLSSSPGSDSSVGSAGLGATAAIAVVGSKGTGTRTAEGADGAPEARDREVRGGSGDSEGSLLSLSASSSN